MRHYLAMALALVAIFGLFAAPQWWKSDEAGFPIEKLASAPKLLPSDAWWLEVDDVKGVVTRRLFRGDEERQRIVISASATKGNSLERTWRGGALVDEIEYGSHGQMLSEKAWSEVSKGTPIWTEVYDYRDGRLAKVTRSDAEGRETGSRSYRYDPLGRLLAVEMSGYYGAVEMGPLGSSGLPRAFWQDVDDETMRIELFNGSGNVAEVRLVKGKDVLSTQHFEYDRTGRLLSDILDDSLDGTRRLSSYGPDGRLSEMKKSKGAAIIENREFSWNEKGDLVSEIRNLPLPKIQIDRGYDKAGALVREERRENGILILVISYEPGSVRIEETLSKGQVVVRARYEGGIKIKEDFLVDGSVVRTRNYR